jgi:hypothetical protein
MRHKQRRANRCRPVGVARLAGFQRISDRVTREARGEEGREDGGVRKRGKDEW